MSIYIMIDSTLQTVGFILKPTISSAHMSSAITQSNKPALLRIQDDLMNGLGRA